MPVQSNAGMLPFDFEQQNQAIAQKRALVAALQAAQVKGPGPSGSMVGPHFVANKSEIISPLLRAFQQRREQGDLDSRQAEFSKQYSTALKDGATSYMDNMQGNPSPVMSTAQADALMNRDVNPNLDPVQPNPRKAIVDAMTSQIPELRDLGRAQMAQIGKAKEDKWHAPVKEVRGGKPVLVQYSDGGQSRVVEGSPLREPLVIQGKVVDKDNPTEVIANHEDQFGPPFAGPGGQYWRKNLATGKVEQIDNAPKTTINTGDKMDKGLSTVRAKMLEESYGTAQKARTGMQALDQASADMDAGIKTGSTADISLALAKFGKSLGLNVDPSIANTEAWRGNMARETFNLIKNLGTGNAISNADLTFAEKASLGKITLDDQAMRRMMAVAKAGAAQTLLDHNKLLNRAQKARGEDAQDLEFFRIDTGFNGGEGRNSIAFNDLTNRFEVQGYGDDPTTQAPTQAGAKPVQPKGMAPGWSVRR